MKNTLLTLLFLSINLYAQFDSVIFKKEMRLNYQIKSIFPLGDQNRDGFDDIMLFDCNDQTGYVYFGGNPIDTIPDRILPFFDSIYIYRDIGVIDLNYDNINDIIITTREVSSSHHSGFVPGDVRIYYGGDNTKSNPDIIFRFPEGASDNIGDINILQDFNGDDKSELVIYDPNLPYSDLQYGTFYFYNTEHEFDTVPHYQIIGDSVIKFKIENILTSSGDINGDGKGDFTYSGYFGEGDNYQTFRSFCLGNGEFNLEPAITYYGKEHSFQPDRMKIVNDMNNDGKDELLIKDYGFYPYYYLNAILFGSFPIDTIPDVGLNTQNLTIGLSITYSLGDVNGDGYNDFFSQTGGYVYRNVKLWLGGKNIPGTLDDVANKTWFGDDYGFGRIISDIGDVDGDGVDDLAIGQILYGAQPNEYCNRGWVHIIKGDTSVITSIKENDISIPEQFKVGEAYPNPFNPETEIKYTISNAAKTEIKLFDALGREIKTLLKEEKQKGEYSITINLNGQSSGTYFVQFQFTTDNNRSFMETKKIILIK